MTKENELGGGVSNKRWHGQYQGKGEKRRVVTIFAESEGIRRMSELVHDPTVTVVGHIPIIHRTKRIARTE
jgi:hypothetical protein